MKKCPHRSVTVTYFKWVCSDCGKEVKDDGLPKINQFTEGDMVLTNDDELGIVLRNHGNNTYNVLLDEEENYSHVRASIYGDQLTLIMKA